MTSVNPEYGVTVSQHLNQSCVSAVLQLNPSCNKFSTRI